MLQMWQWFLLLITAAEICCGRNVTGQDLSTILAYFKWQGPVSITCPEMKNARLTMRDMLKSASNSLTINFELGMEKEDHRSIGNWYVVCSTSSNIGHTIDFVSWVQKQMSEASSKWIIVCDDNSCQKLIESLNVHIGQRVYLVNTHNDEVSEFYSINGLVKIEKLSKMSKDGAFMKDLRAPFVRRRSNFHGSRLLVLTNKQSPHVHLIRENEPNVVNLETTASGDLLEEIDPEILGGTHPDALRQLQEDLNFTTRIFMRRDRDWGLLINHENGSTQWSGMVSSLVKGEIDLVAAPLTNTFYRFCF